MIEQAPPATPDEISGHIEAATRLAFQCNELKTKSDIARLVSRLTRALKSEDIGESEVARHVWETLEEFNL